MASTGAAKVTFTETDLSFFISQLTANRTGVNIRTRRGPINDPQLIGNPTAYREKFGIALTDSNADQVIMRALNRGAVLYVNRIAHYTDPGDATTLDAVAATLSLVNKTTGDPTMTLTASDEGAWGNGLLVTIAENAGDSERFDLTIAFPEQPEMGETWQSLTMDEDDERYAVTFLNENSKLVTAEDEDSGDPFVGDTVNVAGGGALTAGTDFVIDMDDYSNMASSLAEALNTQDAGANFVATYSSNVVTITAATAGTSGNSITLAVTTTSDNITKSGSTLSGGAAAVAATGTVTYGSPSNGDTITVDGTTFTKAASGSATEFSTIGELTALITALSSVNATDDGSVITVTAATAGTAGNSIAMSKTGSALTLSAATLLGGTAAVAATGTITFDTTPTVIDNPAEIGPVALSGGDDGAAVDDDDYIGDSAAATGLYAFDNNSEIFGLCSIEATSAAVTTAGVAYADNREDLVYYCEPPSTADTPSEALEFRYGTGAYSHAAFNSSFAAMYFDSPLVRSSLTNSVIPISNQGDVIGAIAYSDKKGEIWSAAAGLTRGRIPNTLGVNYNVGTPGRSAEEDSLCNAQINPIINDPMDGTMIWGEQTLLTTASALQSLHIRRLLIYMRKALTRFSRIFLFEPNDPSTWRKIYNALDPWMVDLKNRGAFYDYLIQGDQDATSIDDAVLNTAEKIDRGEYNCNIFIKPTRTTLYINLNAVITKSSADFKELLDIRL